MDAITLKATDLIKIKLGVKTAAGVVEPIEAGETFAVTSTDATVVPGSIDETDPLNPLLVVNALMLPGPTTAEAPIVLTVTNSKKDTVYEVGVTYPVPAAVGEITADLANAVVDTQPAPTAVAP